MFTTLIRTQSESSNLRHFHGVGFQCSSCWLELPTDHTPVGTGYAYDRTGNLVCYACCTKQDIENLKDQSRPFYAYVSCDGATLGNWTGAALGNVHAYTESRTGWNGGTIARFHVRDVHGQWWQGRGMGKGMCCTLRKMNKPAYAAKLGD